ncbi:hypothetical protein OG625_14775 [Streptomyces sp. NBC_01351]|uniref:hypothetical protein n=1 Tax=Streptomyces sp. NBC_01351 TaxID=2903833 RepID=UPI002E364F93|nr:hypothetical protein [Streptomyces sp. NBC_01351]
MAAVIGWRAGAREGEDAPVSIAYRYGVMRMGYFTRRNLFHGVGHQQVYDALAEFWEGERHTLVPADRETRDAYTLYEQRGGWTVLEWNIGWEWDLRRRAQFHVSRAYDCPGLLTFVHDGDFWAYELFHHGEAVDHFIQWVYPGQSWFPGRPIDGRPELLVAQFPALKLNVEHARGYLSSIRLDELPEDDPLWDDEDDEDPRAQPVREGDEAGRLDALAVFDFWRYLGVDPEAPAWRRFTTEGV